MVALAAVFALTGRTRRSRRLLIAAALLIAVTGVVAIPDGVLRRLEDVYPRQTDPSSCEGAIILGGVFETGMKPLERDEVSIGSAAERMTSAVVLARTYPRLRIVFSGFFGTLDTRGLSEAELARRFFREQGIDAARVLYETRSRDTYENAMFARQLDGVDPAKPWLLVTSARHMPRAIGVFRKAGWNVKAWPVDYATGRTIDYWEFSVVGGASRWQVLLHELIGTAVYRAIGRL